MSEISVVIPTYNRREFLPLAIRSVLNQTFQDFEIIVVDDGSLDYSAKEIVGEFRDPRIRYIRHEVNKGLSAARNTGIKVSKGRYIAFLDDDDEWLPEKLELQLDLFKKSSSDVGVVYTGCLKVDRSSGKVIQHMIPTKRGNILKDLLLRDCVIAGGSTALVRKECFNKVGLFDENLLAWEAYDMWIRISQVFLFEYIDLPLVKYYHHRNKMSTNFNLLIKGIELMFKKHDRLFYQSKKGFSYHYLRLGVIYCLSGDVKRGRYAFIKAIKLYPFGVRHYFNLVLSLLGAGNFKKVKEAKDQLVLSLKS